MVTKFILEVNTLTKNSKFGILSDLLKCCSLALAGQNTSVYCQLSYFPQSTHLGPSNPSASEAEGEASVLPQGECYNQFLNMVMGSISEVLNTGQMEDIITLTEEIKDNMGEGSVNDLAEHLVSSGSDLGVNDFIHRCLMQGLARGLWHHVDGTWQITE